MKSFKDYMFEAAYIAENPVPGDHFDIEVDTDTLIETVVTELLQDGIIIDLDEAAIAALDRAGCIFEDGAPAGGNSGMAGANDSASPIHGKISNMDDPNDGFMSPINGSAFIPYNRKEDSRNWMRTKTSKVTQKDPVAMSGAGAEEKNEAEQRRRQNIANHNMTNNVSEAKYQGHEVPLGKPMAGDVKKSKVYVRNPSTGNIKKVNFGDPNMRIKKSIPARRKSFRARHNCANPGPRTKARYWSCRKW